ncbi:anthranilate synthase component I [Methanopyrus kandleri]|uniref:Anthranilate synthase component 1 n=1 Tax=Methanopyrus kandleri (strain AV19 / DSM 6324 / JCM 9639 / NBRC 100938) TaxID=190192 RepID=Q8TY68_METKA|nr:anthranilate synthase component I [Methanopyrus kandleri]AAM01652.1 Anthranilate/para-aminobenzoate synthase component I [Methanopyrus kandleri AV19]
MRLTVRELDIDRSPDEVYAALRTLSSHTFLFESAEIGASGRYSFVGFSPALRIECVDGRVRVDVGDPEYADLVVEGRKETDEDHFQLMRRVFSRIPKVEGSGFVGGLVGYISYDVVEDWLDVKSTTVADPEWPSFELCLYDSVVRFDHYEDRVELISVHPDDYEVEWTAEAIEECVREVSGQTAPKVHRTGELKRDLEKEEFEGIVERAKEYIISGDIFQVVLSRRVEVRAVADPLEVYRRLRDINPSPYMYCLEFGERRIIGSSPETLVRLEGDRIITKPIAGTRPRGSTPEEDEELAREMLEDEKELAEHAMLVDLARNDVGKVSRPGTVEVTRLMEIEKYSHVQHIVSEVVGERKEGVTPWDVLRATFPAGTVSGAPKVRAMEIIDELEVYKRGPYAGGVGYVSWTGDMDFAISIRTIFSTGRRWFTQAGAGIVYDSVPENEWFETENKMKAMVGAILEETSSDK